MTHSKLRAAVLAAIAFAAAAGPAGAATIAFSGTEQNTNPPAQPGGRCGPALTVNIGPPSADGWSNLGGFVPTQSHCVSAPPPTSYYDGLFDFAFDAGDSLTGVYTGVLSASGTPGVFDNLQNFVATGGTGRFLGASGAFTGTGTVQFLPTGLGQGWLSFQGQIDAPGVPEPASWLLMILGFGATGATLRRRRVAAVGF